MKNYIGIELGTHFSVAAWLDEKGQPVVVNTGEAIIGNAKQNMGSRAKTIAVGGRKYSAEDILVNTLKNVKRIAKDNMNSPVLGAVVTTPAYFTEAQKNALLAGAEKARLNVLGLVSEAEAIASAYNIKKSDDEAQHVLVYDLGAETFDVTVLKIGEGESKVLASLGNRKLGGHNFDQIIYNWFSREAEKDGIVLCEEEDAIAALWPEAEKAKKVLSGREKEAVITVPVGDKQIEKTLTLARFEILIEAIIYKTINLMNSAMQEANLEYSDLDCILLAGGSTRIPLISTLIEDETGIVPSLDVEPDEAVAVGAAYIADTYKSMDEEMGLGIEDPAPVVKEEKNEPEELGTDPKEEPKAETVPAEPEKVKMKPEEPAPKKPSGKKKSLALEWEEEEPEIQDEPVTVEEPETQNEPAEPAEPEVQDEPGTPAEPDIAKETKSREEFTPPAHEKSVSGKPAVQEKPKSDSRKNTGKTYFIDLYDVFGLDRTMSVKEIKTTLGYRSVDLAKLEASTNPHDRQTRKDIQDMKELLLEAMKILGDEKSRREYDIKLDAAIKNGQVEQNRTKDVEDALERAREYFKQGKYDLALESATEAKNNHANSAEVCEIIARSMFMLGDYMESVDAVDQGAKAFPSAMELHWLSIRFRIQLEMYEEAQDLLNQAIQHFGKHPQLMAEQVYLYLYAEKEKQAKQSIEEYLKENPNDMEYRQYISYNLVEIVNMYYKYDSNAEMLLITEEDIYNKCLELITLANQYYQDDYTKAELDKVTQFGKKEYDKENKPMRICYIIITALAALAGVSALFSGEGAILAIPYLVVAILGVFVVKLVDKYSYRPYWQIYRDYYRGYKERNDSFIFTILSFPFETARSFFK